MKETKLNKLSERYLAGDELALEDLCKVFLPEIQKHSEEIWHSIENQAEFECRCLLKVKDAIRKFDPTRGKLFSRIVHVIKKEKYDYLSRRKRKISDVVSLDKPLYTDDEGNDVLLEVQDVLANVENNILEEELIKEKAALLTKGDSRELAILKGWIGGEFNDLELARVLAHSLGGKIDTHRKAIQRFRTECKKRLATV